MFPRHTVIRALLPRLPLLRYSTQTSVTSKYSHLAQTTFDRVVQGKWRDTDEQLKAINRIVQAISDAATENVKSSSSGDTSLPFLVNRKTGDFLSASNWPAQLPLAHLRIFWQPTNDVDRVLPKECEPNDEEMERYQKFLAPEYDKDFFKNPSQWSFGNTYEDAVARALYRLLQASSETVDVEDKVEAYTDDFFSILRDYIKMEDFQTHNFKILRSQNIIGTIFGNKYNAKPEFVLQDHRGSFQVFMEKGDDALSTQNKRLKYPVPDGFAKSISQKAAEALAIATHRFFASESAGKSQEVFGIGIRHYYFTFWHAFFSREYLASVTGQQWKGDEHVIFKSYPYSEFGLDFCDPAQRKDILVYIHRILNYLQQ